MRWAHASELADPVPYMDGGELLLDHRPQAGRRGPGRHAPLRPAAGGRGRRRDSASPSASTTTDIPTALVDAAEEDGLPLLEVPRRTPFLAISKAVSAAIAADQYRAVTAGFDGPARTDPRRPRRGRPRGAARPRSPRTSTAGPRCTTPRAPSSPPRPTGPPAAPPGSPPTWNGCGTGPRPRARVVGGGRRRGRPGRAPVARHRPPRRGPRWPSARRPRSARPSATRVHSAVALLTLTTERSRALQDAEQRLGAAVLRMLLAGEPDHARAVAGDLYGGLLDAPFRLVVARPTAPRPVRRRRPRGRLAEARSRRRAGRGRARRVPPRRARRGRAGRARGRSGWSCSPRTAARRWPRARSTPRHVAGARGRGRPVAPTARSAGPTRTSWSSACPRRPGPIAAAAAYKQAEQALSVARRRGAGAGRARGAGRRVGAAAARRRRRTGLRGRDAACRCTSTTRRGEATWSRRCGPGSPGTGSGTRPRRIWACTGTRCGTGCAGWRRSWAARWTTRTCGWSCGWRSRRRRRVGGVRRLVPPAAAPTRPGLYRAAARPSPPSALTGLVRQTPDGLEMRAGAGGGGAPRRTPNRPTVDPPPLHLGQ